MIPEATAGLSSFLSADEPAWALWEESAGQEVKAGEGSALQEPGEGASGGPGRGDRSSSSVLPALPSDEA